jgi:uncharacterized membrane protein YgcG
MNSFNDDWLNKWCLQAVKTSIGDELEQRFGWQPFYSLDELEIACREKNVSEESKICAIAMFAEPDQAQDGLLNYGISDPAAELRRIMASKLSFSDTIGIDSGGNIFHGTSSADSDGFSTGGSSDGGGFSDGGGGGGGGDGG